MLRRFTIHTIAILVFSSKSLQAQQISFENYSKSDGLVNNDVRCIQQSPAGLLYFGTASGLSIFDGSTFNNIDVKKGFAHNIISGIAQSGSGTLVFTETNQFYRLRDQKFSLDSARAGIAIKNIYRGIADKWYACTFDGLYLFDDNRLTRLPVSAGRAYPGINCVAQWQDSLLVVGRSYEQLDIYNVRTWQLAGHSREKYFVRNICTDAQGNCWIATIGAGVVLLRPDGLHNGIADKSVLPPAFGPYVHAEFRAIVSDHENNLWMGSIGKGLIRYNPSTGECKSITMNEGLAGNTIFSLFCDKQDNTWIGTNRGLQKLPHDYVSSYTARQGLPADLVICFLLLPGGRAITSGYSGAAYLTPKKITAFQPPLDDEYFLHFANAGKKYFGLLLRELDELTVRNNRILTSRRYSLPLHFRAMEKLAPDKLLLGGDSSIVVFQHNHLETLTKDHTYYISCMAIAQDDLLLTGSLRSEINGYRLMANKNHTGASMVFHYKSPRKGVQDFIQCITSGKNKSVIYGTSQSGLFVASFRADSIQPLYQVNTLSGLSSNNVTALCWYDDSTLLAGTATGMSRLKFTAEHEYRVEPINEDYNSYGQVFSIQKDDKGGIVAGTETGFIRIPAIAFMQKKRNRLPVIISSVRLLSNPDSVLDYSGVIKLHYYNTGITISYASPFFLHEKNIQFTCRLEEDKKLIASQHTLSNHVTFPHLAPGDYRFSVSAFNAEGETSAVAASVTILVRAPFWQRAWFVATVILGIILLVITAWRKRMAALHREADLKNKITATEMMALRSQMNPHFIFNCMNSIDSLITGDRPEEAQDFLQKFSRLIRLVLENSQHQWVPLRQDLVALQLYTELEAIRSSNHFSYQFIVDPALMDKECMVPPMLLQPYVENAIVHGLRNRENTGGHLLVSIKNDLTSIVITVEDNGIGRANATLLMEANPKPYPHRHLGMKMTGKRISLLQVIGDGKVEVRVEDIYPTGDTGTRVVIRLPMQAT